MERGARGSYNCWPAGPPRWQQWPWRTRWLAWCGRSWPRVNAIVSLLCRRHNHCRENWRSGGWEGQTDVNAGSGRTGKRDTPFVPEHLGMRGYGRDPFAKGIMASGREHRTKRSNTWPHRPTLRKRQTNPLPTGSRPHMARRRIGQERVRLGADRRSRCASLDELAALINWTEIDRVLAPVYAAARGERAWPPLALFKALLLSVWYDLSDVKLAEALDDRTSFRRFCGFAAEEPTPERTAFVRFRRALLARNLDRVLFAAVTDQLDAQGMMVKTGTLVDATLIASASIKSDDEARWAGHRRKKPVHGYKAHVATDEAGGLVRTVEITTANVHDGIMLDAVLPHEPGEVYADSAYAADRFTKVIRARGGVAGSTPTPGAALRH